MVQVSDRAREGLGRVTVTAKLKVRGVTGGVLRSMLADRGGRVRTVLGGCVDV